MKALRRSKPWRGTTQERLAKFRACLASLSAAYSIPCPGLDLIPGCTGLYYVRSMGVSVIAMDRLSVVTLLHEFGHARGFDERQTCIWSLNLFRRVFPRAFARCRQEGHCLFLENSCP